MSKVKEIITYRISKYSVPLIVLFFLCIITYCYEYYYLELKEQIIPSAFAIRCQNNGDVLIKTPKTPNSINDFPFNIDREIIKKLLKIQLITKDPVNRICHSPLSNTYSSSIQEVGGGAFRYIDVFIQIEPIKLVNKVTRNIPFSSPLGQFIEGLIDTNRNPAGNPNILDGLESEDCPNPSKGLLTFTCKKGLTTLAITPNDQKLVLGASTNSTNGIIVISERDGGKIDALIKACDKTNYSLSPNSVIEIVCEK